MARLYLVPGLKRLAETRPAIDIALREVEVTLVRLVWAATRSLPLERASDLGAWIGGNVGPRLRKHRHVVLNLKIAFPDRDPAWIERTARDVWRQIGRTLAEYPHLESIAGAMDERIEFVNEFDTARLRGAANGHVLVAMHQANWNIPILAGALGRFPFAAVFAEQKYPRFEAMIARHRSRLPAGFIPVDTGARGMLGALQAGTNVGVLVDHRIDSGEPVPFFGHDANTTIIPARLAHKLGTTVIPTRVERLPGARFRVTLTEPIAADAMIADRRDAAIDMMRRVHERFESWIEARPADWCCVKRRWPKEIVAGTPRHPRAPTRQRTGLAA